MTGRPHSIRNIPWAVVYDAAKIAPLSLGMQA